MLHTGIIGAGGGGCVTVESQEVLLVLKIIGRKSCVHRMGVQESGVGR